MKKQLSTAIASLICVAMSAGAQHVTALRFGKVVDGRGGVTPNGIVIVRDDKVAQIVTSESAIPAGATVIDLRKYTAIPGMIDAHTHMTFGWDKSPGTRPWTQLGTLNTLVAGFLAQENAKRTLETGVTTVRDLGSFDYLDLGLRELINRGSVMGPRMFVAGYGLHVSNAVPKPGVVQPDPGLADGVVEVQRVARQQLSNGADWVKMYGSTGSDQDLTGFQTFTQEEMRAAVDVAHKAGKRVAIHSYGPDGARDAIASGAESVEHATDMDDATISAMAAKGTFYVPTVDHNRYYAAHAAEFGYDQAVIDRLNDYTNRNFETLKKAVRAKVKIAMGSDAVFTGFGENTRELDWFVKAGMTPAQALATATKNGAELLGHANDLGAIAPGYFADIVAVEGDPLADIRVVIDKVRWVMKGGQVVVDSTKK